MATTKKAASKSAHKTVEDASTLYVDKSKSSEDDSAAKAAEALQEAVAKAKKAGLTVSGSFAHENSDGSTTNGRFGK